MKVYKIGLVSIMALLLVAGVGVLPYAHAASPSVVNLGTAGNFAILSESGITNVPASAITGNIGTSPITGAAITGLTCPQVTGTIYTVDTAGPAPCSVKDPARLHTAVHDMMTAYTDAAGRACGISEGVTDLSGLTFTTGVYCWTANAAASSGFTISGSSSDVFIFQIPGTLTVSSGVIVTLSGGASASNIFWQVAMTTALQSGVGFQGIILDATDITMTSGAMLTGRALAQTDVTLIMNVITAPPTTPPPPPPHGEKGTTFNCPGTKGLTVTLASPPKGSSLVLDIKHDVQNDEDSGLQGYWAFDYYTVHLQVWKLADGSYYAMKTYDGIFQTPQGAVSPGATTPSSTEQQSAFGDFQGGYVATFTATSFNPSGYPTHGNVGAFNYGGTAADILLGTYGNGQTGDATPFSFLSAYFPGSASFTQPSWGWVYSLDKQFQSSTSVNTWCNFISGNIGNILVTASTQTVPA